VAGDVPTGLALLQGQRFVVVGEVLKGSHDAIRMVVRHDGGCDGLTAEKYFTDQHRTIATSFGGGPQYFTHLFLTSNNISENDVTLKSLKPDEMPNAIYGKSVDAIAIFDPAASQAEQDRSYGHCTFPDPGVYREHYVIVVRDGALRPVLDERLKGFVAALQDAAQFAAQQPAEAQKIVSAATGLNPQQIAMMWDKFAFGVTLDADLPRLWRAEADWQRTQWPTTAEFAHPDYGRVIDASLIAAQ
jgi:ABC-type nitrate/sulfonate/bicarbonate transport system substrate-binding protein